MKNSLYCALAVSLLFSLTARSQNEGIKASANPVSMEKTQLQPVSADDLAMIQENSTGGGSTTPEGLFTRPQGIYLEPGWAEGRVILPDNSVMENLMLRYDLYHQQVQFVRGNDTLAFAKPEEMKCFVLDGRNFIYSDYQKEGLCGKGFFEVLSEGDCKLLVRRTVTYHLNSGTESNVENDLFVRECEYFIMKNGSVAKPVRACKKSVLCVFKDKEEQVRDYMEENHLRMNTCDQLKEVVAYYNSLP